MRFKLKIKFKRDRGLETGPDEQDFLDWFDAELNDKELPFVENDSEDNNILIFEDLEHEELSMVEKYLKDVEPETFLGVQIFKYVAERQWDTRKIKLLQY
jgi:hypothetical protein